MRWLSVLLLGSLAGCASAPSPTTTASFIPGSDVIQVIVHNEQPVRGVQLVAPDGTVTHATSINTDRLIEPNSGSSVGVGIGGFGFGRGGGFGSSVGVGFPVGGGSRPVDTVASASIPVAPGYRADWQHYHIEVLVGEPSRIISIAAPQPS